MTTVANEPPSPVSLVVERSKPARQDAGASTISEPGLNAYSSGPLYGRLPSTAGQNPPWIEWAANLAEACFDKVNVSVTLTTGLALMLRRNKKT